MPTPRSLTTAPHRNFELEVVSGRVADRHQRRGPVSSPQNTGDLPYGIFDFGAICRLSLEPGARGAGPGRFAWQARRPSRRPGKRLFDRHPELFTAGRARLHLAVRLAQLRQHRTAAVGRPAVRHVGRGPPGRAAPRDPRVRGRGRPHRQLGRAAPWTCGGVLPVPALLRPPGRRPRAPLPVDGEARARSWGATFGIAPVASCATTATTAPGCATGRSRASRSTARSTPSARPATG